MAKSMVYSIYDSKVQFYDRPLFMRNRAEAIRAWSEAANDPKSHVSRHPEDYSLMEIGEFDDQTGKLTSLSAPESIGLAVHYKNPPESPAPLFDANNR